MNARIVAQIVAVAGVLGSLVVGCAVQTGDETTGASSDAISANPRPPPVVTITCGTAELLDHSGDNNFEYGLWALGCTNKEPYQSTTTGMAMFESRCNPATTAYVYCAADEQGETLNAAEFVNCWAGLAGTGELNASYSSSSACSNLVGGGTTSWVYVNFDPSCTGVCDAKTSIHQ
jgi:hypothetical protein